MLIDKNKILKVNLSFGLLWKFANILFVYLSVPILLNFLGSESYGVWVTIFTLLNSAYFMDFGISLGLKNKLTEALAFNNINESRTIISTAYICTFFIVIFLLIFSVILIYNYNFQELFNTTISESELKTTMLACSFFVVSGLVLNLYKSLLNAVQKSSKVELAMAVYQGLIFFQFLFLNKINNKSLIIISIIYGFTNLLIAILFSIYFFKRNKNLIPSIKLFKKDKIKELFGLGTRFFIIQISLVIILTTDNLIITNLIDPKATTIYSIVNKVYQPFIIISTFVFTPLWTLYTNAYQNNDIDWIKKTLKRLNIFFIFLIISLIILYFIFDFIIQIWIPKPINYPNILLVCFSLFVLIKIYGDIYMTFLNSIGKINLQMWLFIIAAIINVPLSILFVRQLEMGSTGVILATCVSLLILGIAMPIQSLKYLKTK